MTNQVQKDLDLLLQVLEEYKQQTTEELDDAIKFYSPFDLEIIKEEINNKLNEITKAVEIVNEWAEKLK